MVECQEMSQSAPMGMQVAPKITARQYQGSAAALEAVSAARLTREVTVASMRSTLFDSTLACQHNATALQMTHEINRSTRLGSLHFFRRRPRRGVATEIIHRWNRSR